MASPTEDDLIALRELTRMTGKLCDVQIQQLKMWPRVILCANNADVEFDPEQYTLIVNISDLDYEVMKLESTKNLVEAFHLRMTRFAQSVQFLLGTDYSIFIRMKDSLLGTFPATNGPINAHPTLRGDYD